MFRKKKTLQAIALSLGLAAMLLPATTLNGQGRPEGLFGSDQPTTDNSPRGLLNQNRSAGANLGSEAFGAAGSEIGNEPFGAPLGGGIGVLLAAGMGYALIQSKKNKQN